jgi:hypothetical protein
MTRAPWYIHLCENIIADFSLVANPQGLNGFRFGAFAKSTLFDIKCQFFVLVGARTKYHIDRTAVYISVAEHHHHAACKHSDPSLYRASH